MEGIYVAGKEIQLGNIYGISSQITPNPKNELRLVLEVELDRQLTRLSMDIKWC